MSSCPGTDTDGQWLHLEAGWRYSSPPLAALLWTTVVAFWGVWGSPCWDRISIRCLHWPLCKTNNKRNGFITVAWHEIIDWERINNSIVDCLCWLAGTAISIVHRPTFTSHISKVTRPSEFGMSVVGPNLWTFRRFVTRTNCPTGCL